MVWFLLALFLALRAFELAVYTLRGRSGLPVIPEALTMAAAYRAEEWSPIWRIALVVVGILSGVPLPSFSVA